MAAIAYLNPPPYPVQSYKTKRIGVYSFPGATINPEYLKLVSMLIPINEVAVVSS